MKIRRATLADIPQLVTLNAPTQNEHAEAMPEKFRTDPPVEDVAEAFRESIDEPSSFWLVAETDCEVVGFLKSEFRDREQSWCTIPHRTCYLGGIVVAPSHRRKGIGRQLVEALQHEARAQELPQIELDVFGFNGAAKAMYENLGFQPVMERLKLSLDGEKPDSPQG
ncbi:MAG: GNAT family N-acetyltransferase [Verrucomicrobiota bacterium]